MSLTNLSLLSLSRTNDYNGSATNQKPKKVFSREYISSYIQKLSDHATIENKFEYTDDILFLLAEVRKKMHANQHDYRVVVGAQDGIWKWSKEQFIELLQGAGFVIQTCEGDENAFAVVISSNTHQYEAFLEGLQLPHSGIKHLIVTTEHSDYRITGGIGSYVKECLALYKSDATALIIDSNNDIDLQKIGENKWLSAQQFLSESKIDEIESSNFDTIADLVWEVLQPILCLYTNVMSIEAQECLLYRTIDAKQMGWVTSEIKLITVCHGSSFHLAKARRDVLEAENIHVAYREKYTIENSDTVVLPTRFLKDSYKQSGIANLDEPSRIIRRLPFDYSRLPQGKSLKKYRRIVYIGKTSTIKGFDLFLSSIIRLYSHHENVLKDVEDIVVIATSTKITEPYLQHMFRFAESVMPIRMVSLAREDLLKTLAEYSEDSLCLITYLGDNHPLTVLELMGIGHDFLAANAAGTPELIPDDFKRQYLVDSNEDAIANEVAKAFSSVKQRSQIIGRLRKQYIEDQKKINESYDVEGIKSYVSLPSTKNAHSNTRIQIFVVDRGDKAALENTLQSLKTQTLPLEIRIIEPSQNDYKIPKNSTAVMRLYAGDVLRPLAIEKMFKLLTQSIDTKAVFCYEQAPVYLANELKGKEEFHPYPPQLGSVFLQEKYGRRFVGLFSADSFRECEKYSDWHIAIRLACERGTVAVVPEMLADLAAIEGYPEENTMLRTNKLAESFTALPLFDAHILQSELKRFDDIYWGSRLMNHMNDVFIRRDEAERIYGPSPMMRQLSRMYRKIPTPLRAVIYKNLKLIHRFVK